MWSRCKRILPQNVQWLGVGGRLGEVESLDVTDYCVLEGIKGLDLLSKEE